MEIRTMLPWNIRCNTCGHYMHRGTKFNSRVEAAVDYPKYLDYITIRRFYIRCLNCVSNITFVTDPEAVVSLKIAMTPFLGCTVSVRDSGQGLTFI